MWKCKGCSEEIESNFDTCWKCGYSRKSSSRKNNNIENSTITMLPNGKLLSDTVESDSFSSTDSLSLPNRQEVAIVDVIVPFWSMVIFMVKWAIASIPAIFILFLIVAIFKLVFLSGGLIAIYNLI